MGTLSRIGWALMATALPLVAVGCGDDQGPAQEPLQIQKAQTKSGDQQTAEPGQTLIDPLRVLVTRAGQPVEQTEVAWTTSSGGSFSDATSVTDALGIATSSWTLGPATGTQTARATVTDALNSPLSFTATAADDGGEPPPPPEGATVQVLGPALDRFGPTVVTITEGATVTWVWAENSLQHNVTPDAGGMPAGEGATLFDAPHEYSFTFTEAGTYHYHCSNHGAAGGVGMSGTVIVEVAK